MVFWIVTTALVLGVSLVFGVTMARGRVGEAPPAAYDLEVYRDQLKEVERDLARQTITDGEAQRIRAEVSRRVLAADAQLREGGETGGQPQAAGWVMAGLSAIALTGGSFWLYTTVGAPGVGDLPLKARIAASDGERAQRLTQADAEARVVRPAEAAEASDEFLDLMAKLREAVEANDNDVRGLTLLARNEALLGNLSAAHKAQAQLVKVKGDAANARDYAFLADLLVTAADGYVSSEAEMALRITLERNPNQFEARYYLGHYFLQVDRPDAAFRTWEKLLVDSPADAPWVGPVRDQIEDVAMRAGVRYQLPEVEQLPGPTADDVEAAQDMATQDQMDMIRGMVSRLSNRLATEGGTPAEWARLIGAYSVLGEMDRASAIWVEAQQVFADNPDAMAQIGAAAVQAGLAE